MLQSMLPSSGGRGVWPMVSDQFIYQTDSRESIYYLFQLLAGIFPLNKVKYEITIVLLLINIYMYP